MKLCSGCADNEMRETSGEPLLARCENCGAIVPCFDDRSTDKPRWRFRFDKTKKPQRKWRFRLKW